MDALRIVRHFSGGVSVRDLLASSRLMQIAAREMRREQAALSAQFESDLQDMRFDAHAAQFFGQGL